ncbi:DUF1800 domain-containing protein [Couchioplanes caeruleus]|uniref:DUF1800 domain-containing protein n=2 Tax=Couchioplanes caeruleus TaxID=56438 RepID=A0A1K0FP74_9ACTN|nr:DUF1800 domain-containing protein [Couchioplanes caeruleus]OJF14647.1 hypothetical protein BG844_08810 [Couchioplanes caeruleus subsp. caeruleus]ROP34439.1 uncharacterized protein (DUF1800 family) [Couchioplanes caeruleus]
MTDRSTVSHLLRRLTFGPTAAEVEAALRAGVPATLDKVLAPVGHPASLPEVGAFRPGREGRADARRDATEATGWWITRMVTEPGAAEKLTFFWHGHWATSVRKVRSAELMLGQQATLRRYGAGGTGALVRAMLRDPALIIWLDAQRNTRKAPNENLARELMELFTLGVGAGYTEADVKAGARVLTGWRADRTGGTATFSARRHDPAPVTLLGRTGTFDADAYADLLVSHPAHRPFLAGRLWARYGADTPPDAATTARLVAQGGSTVAMLRALVGDPAFAGCRGRLVKQPVEWMVGAARQLGIDPERGRSRILAGLRALGQVPFRPPSVGGWPAGTAWLTTSSAQARLASGRALAALAPEAVGTLGDTARADRPDALARILVVDEWTARTRAVLAGAAGDPRLLLTLGLASPEYAVH